MMGDHHFGLASYLITPISHITNCQPLEPHEVHYNLSFLQLCLPFITQVGALGCVCMFYLDSLMSFELFDLCYLFLLSSSYHPTLIMFPYSSFSSNFRVFVFTCFISLTLFHLIDDFSHFQCIKIVMSYPLFHLLTLIQTSQLERWCQDLDFIHLLVIGVGIPLRFVYDSYFYQ